MLLSCVTHQLTTMWSKRIIVWWVVSRMQKIRNHRCKQLDKLFRCSVLLLLFYFSWFLVGFFFFFCFLLFFFCFFFCFFVLFFFVNRVELQWLEHRWLVYHGWFELVFWVSRKFFRSLNHTNILRKFSYFIMKMYVVCTNLESPQRLIRQWSHWSDCVDV